MQAEGPLLCPAPRGRIPAPRGVGPVPPPSPLGTAVPCCRHAAKPGARDPRAGETASTKEIICLGKSLAGGKRGAGGSKAGALQPPQGEGWGGTKASSTQGFVQLRALLGCSRPLLTLSPPRPRSGWGLLNRGGGLRSPAETLTSGGCSKRSSVATCFLIIIAINFKCCDSAASASPSSPSPSSPPRPRPTPLQAEPHQAEAPLGFK